MTNQEPQGETPPAASPAVEHGKAKFRSHRFHFLGLDSDDIVRSFFGGNATLAIVVLVLIMFFLFREGAGFFGQNASDQTVYRQSGLEYVDVMRTQLDDYYRLPRYLTNIEANELRRLQKSEKLSLADARKETRALHDYTAQIRSASRPLSLFVNDLSDKGISLRDSYKTNANLASKRDSLMADAASRRARGDESGALAAEKEASLIVVKDVNLATRREEITASLPRFHELNNALRARLDELLRNLPPANGHDNSRLEKFRNLAREHIQRTYDAEKILAVWNPDRPVTLWSRATGFLFGERWVTNSYFQDWYGVLPLLYGSLIVSLIALCIAIPLGVAGAIYVNLFAHRREQAFIKPYIEFISAIPSVVIGFFGVIVWGQFVREASNWELFNWLPFCPISERLNAFTAGGLLALMAIPTIFTLAEDALNNVPKAYKEASYAVGSTRLQTAIRIVVPTALSGIVSAILLGFGRVIGETMVVLLCAGNRIVLPDITVDGMGVFFSPVHTMTGLVAQEMGEVVSGGAHYRALFLVGTLLFFISLGINYLAQKIMRRYSIAER